MHKKFNHYLRVWFQLIKFDVNELNDYTLSSLWIYHTQSQSFEQSIKTSSEQMQKHCINMGKIGRYYIRGNDS